MISLDSTGKQVALPPAALRHRSWWDNDDDTEHAQQWLAAGWRVVGVDLTEGRVVFARDRGELQIATEVFARLFAHLARAPAWTAPLPEPAGKAHQTLLTRPVVGGQAMIDLGFKDQRFRVSLRLDGGDDRSKQAYDLLATRRDAIDRELGTALHWNRNPHRREARIELRYPEPISLHASSEALEALGEWLAQTLPRFCAATLSAVAADADA